MHTAPIAPQPGESRARLVQTRSASSASLSYLFLGYGAGREEKKFEWSSIPLSDNRTFARALVCTAAPTRHFMPAVQLFFFFFVGFKKKKFSDVLGLFTPPAPLLTCQTCQTLYTASIRQCQDVAIYMHTCFSKRRKEGNATNSCC